MVDLRVSIGGLRLANPVIMASGTFGYGLEFADLVPLAKLGGVVVKGTTLSAREGNPPPRMAETASGMLNCVGLQNKGVDYFVGHIYPELPVGDTCFIVNISGSSPEEYALCAQRIAEGTDLEAVELNISCPNVKEGGLAFGTDPRAAASVVKAVRKAWPRTLIVKLSPNVTDITQIARAAEGEGADALSLINTLRGMAIDVRTRRRSLSIGTGGLSGPAIKPVALAMVYDVAKAVTVPVIGMGGITTATDAVEFLLAGARAVEIGTASFVDPTTGVKVVEGIGDYLASHGHRGVGDIVGTVQ